MEKKNANKEALSVKCAHCRKPFHFTPQAKAEAKQTGDVEIALECPFCQKQNIVKVPAKMAGKETMLRGGKSHNA
jgi:endogenous inhibitor of DNA gyrase (YacG/DUF329 family)